MQWEDEITREGKKYQERKETETTIRLASTRKGDRETKRQRDAKQEREGNIGSISLMSDISYCHPLT